MKQNFLRGKCIMERFFAQENAGKVNGWAVWKLVGALDSDTADTAYEMGQSLIQENENIAIDMTEMDYLSSAGIRILLRLTKQASAEGKEFALVGATGMVKVVLAESRMDMFVTIYESADELP